MSWFLIQFSAEDESNAGKLQKLFDVSRVIMKTKHESCEEIMEEYEKEVKSSKKKGMSRSPENHWRKNFNGETNEMKYVFVIRVSVNIDPLCNFREKNFLLLPKTSPTGSS